MSGPPPVPQHTQPRASAASPIAWGFGLPCGCLIFVLLLLSSPFLLAIILPALGRASQAAKDAKTPTIIRPTEGEVAPVVAIPEPEPAPTPVVAPEVGPAPSAESLGLEPQYKSQSFGEWLAGDPPVRIDPTPEEAAAANAAAVELQHWTDAANSVTIGMDAAAVAGLLGEGAPVRSARVNGKSVATREWQIGDYIFVVEFTDGKVSRAGWG